MCKLRHLVVCLAFVAGLFRIDPARADYAEAETAASKGDYATARQALAPLDLGDDPRVFRLLGELDRDGKGAAADLVKAYRNFSLFGMYTEDPDERATAFALRREATWKMQDRISGLAEGERLVIVQVDSRLGGDQRIRQVEEIRTALKACKDHCDDIAARVFRLGPAAREVIPELDALMTRDPYWMPRETYAYALAYIGVQAVPALARAYLDRKEMAAEGFWNVGRASAALQALGPTAYAAVPVLAEAMVADYSGLGGEQQELSDDFGTRGPGELVFEVKVGIAKALISIKDVDHKVHDQLASYFRKETDIGLKLLTGWTIGLMYEEPEPVLPLVEQNITSLDETVVLLCLVILGDFHSSDNARPRLQRLLPKVEQISHKGSERNRAMARRILKLYR